MSQGGAAIDRNSDESYAEVIDDLTEKHDCLSKALAKCDPEDELCPTASLRGIVERVARTLQALKDRAVCRSDLGKFRIKVTIPRTSSRQSALVTIRLDQMRTSKSLDINYYVVIKAPTGDELTTPRVVSTATCMNYVHTFMIPDRSPRSIAFAKAADVDFTIWKYTPMAEVKIGKGRSTLIASAKAQVMPLCFAAVSSGPLDFKTPTGQKTEYVFEATLTTDEPLIPENGMTIDEQMELIRE